MTDLIIEDETASHKLWTPGYDADQYDPWAIPFQRINRPTRRADKPISPLLTISDIGASSVFAQAVPLPRPNLIVASMWAISDFRADNGATLLVPGSHRWPNGRAPEPHEVVQAEMPAGSVLFWMGGLLHGAGENTSDDWRYGVILTYSLGWVRQEENQYLDLPRERIAELAPEVRRTVGVDMYGALGFYDPTVT